MIGAGGGHGGHGHGGRGHGGGILLLDPAYLALNGFPDGDDFGAESADVASVQNEIQALKTAVSASNGAAYRVYKQRLKAAEAKLKAVQQMPVRQTQVAGEVGTYPEDGMSEFRGMHFGSEFGCHTKRQMG